MNTCSCRSCNTNSRHLFIVCQVCGNKRCPKATDHELACTGSNEPGQAGSFYGPTEQLSERYRAQLDGIVNALLANAAAGH
jgi:hypothetical protein